MSKPNNDSDRLLPFAGLTRYSDESVPEDAFGHGSSIKWWAKERGRYNDTDGDDPSEIEMPDRSLNTLIDTLPRAATCEAAWVHPTTGETINTTKHNAVVNPETVRRFAQLPETLKASTADELRDNLSDLDRAELVDCVTVAGIDLPHEMEEDEAEQATLADGGATSVADYSDDALVDALAEQTPTGDSCLYQIPTGDYAVLNPTDFLRPLANLLRDEDMGDSVFGEARVFRSGGKVSLDVFFDGKNVDLVGERFDDDRNPIVVGAQVDWDHFGGTSVQIQGMAMDWECTNALRSFTEKMKVKHAGDVDERDFKVGSHTVSTWRAAWEKILEILDLKRDQLSQFIEEAEEEVLDLSELPEDFDVDYSTDFGKVGAYFHRAGLPKYLAKRAAQNVRAEAADPFEPTMWDLHRGATYAISHYSNADSHADSAVEDHNRTANDLLFNPVQIQDRVVEQYREDKADDDGLEGEGGGVASIERATGDLAEKREEFNERQEQIASLYAGDE